MVISGSQHCSLVAHRLSVPGNCGSNPSEGEKLSSFIFEAQFYDCCLPLNSGEFKCRLFSNDQIHAVHY